MNKVMVNFFIRLCILKQSLFFISFFLWQMHVAIRHRLSLLPFFMFQVDFDCFFILNTTEVGNRVWFLMRFFTKVRKKWREEKRQNRDSLLSNHRFLLFFLHYSKWIIIFAYQMMDTYEESFYHYRKNSGRIFLWPSVGNSEDNMWLDEWRQHLSYVAS